MKICGLLLLLMITNWMRRHLGISRNAFCSTSLAFNHIFSSVFPLYCMKRIIIVIVVVTSYDLSHLLSEWKYDETKLTENSLRCLFVYERRQQCQTDAMRVESRESCAYVCSKRKIEPCERQSLFIYFLQTEWAKKVLCIDPEKYITMNLCIVGRMWICVGIRVSYARKNVCASCGSFRLSRILYIWKL